MDEAGNPIIRGPDNVSAAEMADILDMSCTRHDLTWFVIDEIGPLQWGCYILTFYDRATGECVLQQWRAELTAVGVEPDIDRALHGGAESLYCSPVYRSYPPFVPCSPAA